MQKFRVVATVEGRKFFALGHMSRGDVLRFLVADMAHAEAAGEMTEQEWIDATGKASRLAREGGILDAGRMQYAVALQGE